MFIHVSIPHLTCLKWVFVDVDNTSIVDVDNNSIVDVGHNSIVDVDNTSIVDVDNTSIVDVGHNSIVDVDNTSIVDVDNTSIVDVGNNSIVDVDNTLIVDVDSTSIVDVDSTSIVDVDNYSLIVDVITLQSTTEPPTLPHPCWKSHAAFVDISRSSITWYINLIYGLLRTVLPAEPAIQCRQAGGGCSQEPVQRNTVTGAAQCRRLCLYIS